MNTVELSWISIIVLCAMFVLIGLGIGGQIEYSTGTAKLGQSICEEEFDMDFSSFSGNKLYCKNKIISNYDGLQVLKRTD